MKSIRVQLEQLKLDPDNPRLPKELSKDQDSMMRYLTENEQVDDLIASIGTGGFITGDPMIARVDPKDPTAFYVIEGNRRLAAMRWLTGYTNRHVRTPSIPDLIDKVSNSFKDITIEIDWDPSSLESYLGYKHVTSAKEWSPEAKARFIISQANGDLSDANLSRFAKSFGSRIATLKRWLVALKALDQAKAETLLTSEQLSSGVNFGTFYTLLGGDQVKNFIEIKGGEIVDNPVQNIENFSQFLGWTIGTKNAGPVVTSRQQSQLETILANPGALEFFKSDPNIRAALQYTEFRSTEVAARLRTAAYDIEKTLPVLNDVRDKADVLEAVDRLRKALKKVELNLEDPS